MSPVPGPLFAESFAHTLALVGIVILVASLLSGLVERSGAPQVAIFLALGAAVGPAGLGLVELTLQSPALQVLATISLVLVLFSDAIAVDLGEARRNRALALRVLGPGTLVPAALIAGAARLVLGLPVPAAVILGAALASTDPVLLRTLLRRPELPPAARLALRLESGMNDVVLLPVVVIGMLVFLPERLTTSELARRGVGLFLLGPVLGAVVGWVAITVLERVRARIGVRRDYESLYALGVAFTAFAAAEAVGGSGFLAAFAAGLVIASLDVELCDCFLDYGEATAEMFLLFTFVALGASLIWIGLTVIDVRTVLFACFALSVRTLVLLPVLRLPGLDTRSRRVIAWFGPRGLSSLLLVLLPVFAGVPGSERLFAVTCLVVLLSVVVHGTAMAFFVRPRAVRDGGTPLPVRESKPELATGDASGQSRERASQRPTGAAPKQGAERITIDELRALWNAGAPVVVADVRTERTYRPDAIQARGAVRLPPDDAVRRARELRIPRDATIALYCA